LGEDRGKKQKKKLEFRKGEFCHRPEKGEEKKKGPLNPNPSIGEKKCL